MINIELSEFGNPLLNNDNININIQNSNFSNIQNMSCIFIDIELINKMNYSIIISNNNFSNNFNSN